MKMNNKCIPTQLLVCLVPKDSFLSDPDPKGFIAESKVRLDVAHLRQEF